MPIYEYLCDDCGNAFEKLVRRETKVDCPSCGRDHVSQQMSTFAAPASGVAKENPAPSCPGGMCATPGMCGRN